MDMIKEFERSLEGRKPSTIRLYLAGAKAAMESAMANVSECGSFPKLLALVREARPEKRVRVAPFLRFLARGGGGTSSSVAKEDVRGIQYWVIQSLAKRIRREKNPSISSRRDMALLASLCVAPAKGSPRNWPRNCLKIAGNEVILWEKRVEEPAFALALRFWDTWRERLTRPDQRRLYRRSIQWSRSDLLFPGPRGRPLSRVALHNALRRLVIVGGMGEGCRLTPRKIRAAFLAEDPLTAGRGFLQGHPETFPPL